jgi:hypothetical protein
MQQSKSQRIKTPRTVKGTFARKKLPRKLLLIALPFGQGCQIFLEKINQNGEK